MTSGTGLPEDLQSWLRSFKEKHGRSLRVLHIGNIANNAYINAKLLNEAGLDCDVVCHSYYHIMACPEWEDADFDGEIKDQLFPNWRPVNLNGFKRPRWFAQGPPRICISYLISKRDGKELRERLWWNILEISRFLRCSWGGRHLTNLSNDLIDRLAALREHPNRAGRAIFTILRALRHRLRSLLDLLLPNVSGSVQPSKKSLESSETIQENVYTNEYSYDEQVDILVRKWKDIFPDRQDRFSDSDVKHYRWITPLWRNLFSRYDIVQGYATAPILPLMCGKPYFAFEHGTLREIPFLETPEGRITALSYSLAEHVFITNGDCLKYAKKIGVVNYSPMIHPLQVERMRSTQGEYERVHQEYGTAYVFLCILRHDWQVKGTDQYIRALPKLKEVLGSDFCLVMTSWGSQIEESKNLALELGVADLIHWIEPLNRLSLTRMLKSIDILFDQIALPHFGGTAPEGIAAEVPVIMSYDPGSTAWIIPEPAPILSAWTIEDIVRCVQQAIDPAWRKEYRERARQWIDTYHDTNVVVQGHIQAYREVLRIEE